MSDGKKFSHRYDKAILALLSEPTLDLAAKKAGIGAATLQRWLHDPNFQAGYRAARQRAFEAGLSRLQALTGEAVEALQRNLTAPRPLVQVRAAVAILTHATQGAELLDLSARLDRLEAGLKEHHDAAA